MDDGPVPVVDILTVLARFLSMPGYFAIMKRGILIRSVIVSNLMDSGAIPVINLRIRITPSMPGYFTIMKRRMPIINGTSGIVSNLMDNVAIPVVNIPAFRVYYVKSIPSHPGYFAIMKGGVPIRSGIISNLTNSRAIPVVNFIMNSI